VAPKHQLYTPEIAEEILERLADGMGLIAVCRLEGMPSHGAVRHWVLTDHCGFAARYARARMIGYEHMADEIIELSDDGSRDTIVGEDGKVTVDHEVVARSRLRVDTRKWLLSKCLPKIYGDRSHTTIDGEIVHTTPEQRQARIDTLLAKRRGLLIEGTATEEHGDQVDG
jgi:hypothetical protein